MRKDQKPGQLYFVLRTLLLYFRTNKDDELDQCSRDLASMHKYNSYSIK